MHGAVLVFLRCGGALMVAEAVGVNVSINVEVYRVVWSRASFLYAYAGDYLSHG